MNTPTPSSPCPAAPFSPKQISRLGFWVISSMVMAFLIALAIPNFVKPRATRSHNSCISNLKQIDGAVRQWAFENKKAASDTYSLSDPLLLRQLRGSVLPVCPAGGSYSPGTNVGGLPKCSFAAMGHTL